MHPEQVAGRLNAMARPIPRNFMTLSGALFSILLYIHGHTAFEYQTPKSGMLSSQNALNGIGAEMLRLSIVTFLVHVGDIDLHALLLNSSGRKYFGLELECIHAFFIIKNGVYRSNRVIFSLKLAFDRCFATECC